MAGLHPSSRFMILVIALLVIGIIVIKYMQPQDGKTLFKREGCVKCHSYRGLGIGVIDLTGVSDYRSDEWIANKIKNSRQIDPNAGMPSFGHLSEGEMHALVLFLKT